MKYKIGDKVKFKSGNGGYEDIENEGVITSILYNKFYMIECIYTDESTIPNFHQTLSFSEKEIEDYA